MSSGTGAIRACCVNLGAREPEPWHRLRPANGIELRVVEPTGLAAALATLQPDVLWVHATSPAEAAAWPAPSSPVLLTGAAVLLPARAGFESVAPNDHVDRPWRDAEDELFLHRDFAETPRIRGHAAFRRHRLFDGLGSAVYTWWPDDGEPYRAWTYRRPAWPADARVIAVERAFIHFNPDRATIWEHPPTDVRPHVLCIGAYLHSAGDGAVFRAHVERLTLNALRYLAGGIPAARPDLYWTDPDVRMIETPTLDLAGHTAPSKTGRTPAPPAVGTASPGQAEPLPIEIASPQLDGGAPDDPITLAGRRTLLTGREGAGADEVWVHPLRIVRGMRIPGSECVALSVTPLGIRRSLRIDGRAVVERSHVPAELPAAILEYERPGNSNGADDRTPLLLRLEWTTDLRLMWPYPAGSTGPLLWRITDDTLVVRSGRTGETALFHIDGPARPQPAPAREPTARFSVSSVSNDSVEAPDARAELRCTLALRLLPGDRLRLFIAAAVSDSDDIDSTLRALRNPVSLVRARAASLRRLQRERLSVTAPEPRVGQAIEWAKARLDGYVVDTPDVGRSLVAGYWTSRPGWNDGRPGYAWYFGRDAAWTALASLACGDFDAARDVITFLGAHQDLTGKILHECTTSGVVHYDAADSTPLYLLLVARYLAWTGDDRFVRGQWSRARSALEFCLSTDGDGDGLIENTRVGHGWIEFGRLGGGRVTYYNAGIWTAALRELSVAAESIGETRMAAELQSRAKTARLALEQLFFDAAGRRYALKASDGPGGWARDYTPTATHAVPLLLGVADADRAGSWLELVASEPFNADWGVRLIPDTEPDFDPQRYHGGAVWPLYTGWVSWAEYAAGRAGAAFRHWRSNLDLAFEREKGAWDEVLHGRERRAAGVCPDQAWSTAMAVSPLVYGLLGAEPDAVKGRLRLRPQIPESWDRFEIRNLRMGTASVRLRYERTGTLHTFAVEQEEGAIPIRLILEPALPGQLVGARVDGEPARLEPRPFGERVLAPVQLVLDHERVVEFEVESTG